MSKLNSIRFQLSFLLGWFAIQFQSLQPSFFLRFAAESVRKAKSLQTNGQSITCATLPFIILPLLTQVLTCSPHIYSSNLPGKTLLKWLCSWGSLYLRHLVLERDPWLPSSPISSLYSHIPLEQLSLINLLKCWFPTPMLPNTFYSFNFFLHWIYHLLIYYIVYWLVYFLSQPFRTIEDIFVHFSYCCNTC